MLEQILLFLAFVAGAVFGSFADAWAYRFVRGESIASGRSSCARCKQIIPWYANIPIVSYLFLRGSCVACGGAISIRHLVSEVVLGSWFALVVGRFGMESLALLYAGAGFFMLILSLIDIERLILPDRFTMLLVLWILATGWQAELPMDDMLLGAAVGGGGLWSIAMFYQSIRKRNGLGFGDVKLMIPIGALCGVFGLPMVLLTASVLGIVFYLLGMAVMSGFSASAKIPFGPFLCVGAGVYLIWGAEMYQLLWRLQ